MMDILFEPYAVRLTLRSAEARGSKYWTHALRVFMETLAQGIAEMEPALIGHLKGFARIPGKGFFKISVVSKDHPAAIDGDMNGVWNELTLDLNVLVYGLERDAISRLTLKTLNAPGKPWSGLVASARSNGSDQR